MATLAPSEVRRALADLPGWSRHRGAIRRTYRFADFPEAIRFVNAVARLAERANHHPDIEIRYNQVTLRLTTHDAGGLTEKDFELARAIEQRLH